jgi:hypothetical protein
MDQWIVQGVGYLALLVVIISFQNNNRVKLLLLMLTAALLFTVHYALLGAWTGSLMNLVGASMIFVSYKKETAVWAQLPFWPYLFIALFILAGILTAENWTGFLPVLAQIFGTVAVWQSNARAIRFFMLIPRPLWFSYNLVVGSYAGMLTEVLVSTSVIVGIVRFDIIPLIPGLRDHNSRRFLRWFRRKDAA